MEQQSGPPSTDRTGEESRSAGRFTRDDETPSTGRFTRDPDRSSPELEADPSTGEEPSGQVTPPEALPVPDQPQADAAESGAEGAPIMSNLPHTRPQQRSQKRAAPKRPAKREASPSTSRKKAAAGRSKAGTASRARSRAQSSAARRPSAPRAAPARSGAQAIPGRAIGTAFQIASAPWRLTARVTRRTANEIGKRLGI